ncbi:MAG: LppA family lipoprotein [Mycobacteriaceae bacterium]|nr:LppA family lipoprotein [Mycobacteriaceae bacterium]
MNRAPRYLALLSAMLMLNGCIKPTTFNPYANPGRPELDRLQEIVNARPDLELVKQQLAQLDIAIRATITKYSPQTTWSSIVISHSPNGCMNPFGRTIGSQVNSDLFFAEPAPDSASWLQIVTELAPVFSAAGFHPNNSAPGDPPLPLGAANDSQIRTDGTLIDFVNGNARSPVDYHHDTGCHLPSAWRTAPPPLSMRPPNDPNVRYPYLYKSPGGRSVDAY